MEHNFTTFFIISLKAISNFEDYEAYNITSAATYHITKFYFIPDYGTEKKKKEIK